MADLSYQWLASAAPPERGCLFGDGRVSERGTLLDPVALVLYRYGALLAVNDAAHRVVPQLPMANAHDRALALGAWPPRSATSMLNS